MGVGPVLHADDVAVVKMSARYIRAARRLAAAAHRRS
jgi:hypothetical protein